MNLVVTILLILIGSAALALLLIWLLGERGSPFRASTWRVLRTGGLKNLFNLNLIRLYVYGRWTGRYIGHQKKKTLPRMREEEKKAWAEKTHFKVLTPEDSRSIVTLDQKIELTSNEKVIPFATAREIILTAPPEIAVYECGCRASSPNPCEPTQVCIVIGQPFVDFILRHHPQTSRRISQEEALEIIRSEHRRGHVQTAWFKDICFGRFYALCNCCKCCCIGIQALTKHNIPMAAPSGYAARVDDGACSGCGECVDACVFEAIRLDGHASVIWETCMGCGVCVEACPSRALSLKRDERKGEPMDLQRLAGEIT